MGFAKHLETPETEYNQWRENWQPPLPLPIALPGKVIVEFSPYANTGSLWLPERESSNAKVVHDGHEGTNYKYGYIPTGQEICYTGASGTYFEYGGRRLCVIKKSAIEMILEP